MEGNTIVLVADSGLTLFDVGRYSFATVISPQSLNGSVSVLLDNQILFAGGSLMTHALLFDPTSNSW